MRNVPRIMQSLFAENQPRIRFGISMNKTALDLQQRVLSLIARGIDTPTSDTEFEALARDVFALQFECNAVYRAYCEQQQRTPESVAQWKEIPAVPTSAFKDFDIACFPTNEAVAEFHTSGTTREQAGKHFFRTLELYDAAIIPNIAAHLLPDFVAAGFMPASPAPIKGAATEKLRMLALTPSPADAPHSSLSHMMGVVIKNFGAAASAFYVADDKLRIDQLLTDLRDAQDVGAPACLLGTAFAFVHLFDACHKNDIRVALPSGSRAIETGGFKGRSREVSKPVLYGLFHKYLRIPPSHVVNEYGMTELSTQFYDQSLRIGIQTDLKFPPPWARVLVIDPRTGREAALNEHGLIRVFDLANVWSSLAIQTEDLGVSRGHGFEILGRAAGAEVRGCSLTAESLRTM